MNSKTGLVTLGLAAVLCGGGGCAAVVVGGAVAAGAGGYAYMSGELRSTESASFDKTWNAAQAAVKEMAYQVISTEKKDALQAELTARNAADKKVTVKLRKVAEAATEVRIRVGTFGDEAISLAILDKIKKRL